MNNIIYFSVFKQKRLILHKNVIFFPKPECESFILKCSEYFTHDSWETGNIYTLIFIASNKPIEILSTNSYRCLSGNFLFSKQVPKDIG